MALRILLVDNHDSFTYNLAHALAVVTGEEPVVVPNDAEVDTAQFDAVVLSPGPGRPDRERDFGICARIIARSGVPLLGVCLGQQGIVSVFGGDVVRAPEPVHGRPSRVLHRGDPLFANIPNSFSAIRYHSLICPEPLPECLEAIAWTEDGTVMALRHRTRPIWGVQFHPEAVCTEYGNEVLRNFVSLAEAARPRLATRRLDGQHSAGELFLRLFAGEPYAFWLDSSDHATQPHRYSYLGAAGAPSTSLDEVARRRLPSALPFPFPFQGGYVGYLGYESTRQAWLRVDRFVALDHDVGAVWLAAASADAGDWFDECERRIRMPPGRTPGSPAPERAPVFDYTVPEAKYKDHIRHCLAAIVNGESYEVCLTNCLRARTGIDPLTYYRVLRAINPAPYSAYLRLDGLEIACSSPELFLRVTPDGGVASRPIKGTSHRSSDAAADAALAEQLRNDPKSRAENMMIVDLVRNDLSRVSVPGSVEVTKLMDVETYATVHQLVSTIEGRLKPGATAVDAIRAAFPPGSMTGAPKARTMEIIASLEPGPRGVYSGAIGWLGNDGAAELNVAIRTAVFSGGEVTIGTGGAIVADSDPDREWDELQLKVRALVEALTLCLSAAPQAPPAGRTGSRLTPD